MRAAAFVLATPIATRSAWSSLIARTCAAAPPLAIADGIALMMLPLPFLLAARDPNKRGAGCALPASGSA